MDIERIEVETANHVDMLSLQLKRLEQNTSRDARSAKAVNTVASKIIRLAQRAKRVSLMYPRMS